ncbi:hypothetical protein OS965_01555 [Streptomyces sp. H27-G5]|uniref:hypothetical protein n=1 Tax=Streptomyces sp. H27-G5 TaxID=2996698 RepID=UPI00226EA169|nr:hypothetical protein [Streptomyces sp. H27-G5]MCY0916862.1 hypothetical protein [Streptomyces sp. H27-G5]
MKRLIRRPSQRSMTLGTAAVLTGLTLFVTACTGGTGASDGSDGSDGKKDGAAGGTEAGGGGDSGKIADDALKMRKCLREHGIDAPDPEPGQDPRGMTLGGGADPEKMQKAMEACGMKGPGSGAGPTQEEKDKELKWVRCMRENGVNLKDPEYTGGMKSATEIPKGQEKAFEEAQKKCEAA